MTKSTHHKGFRFRAVVSFVLTFASLVMVVSGILLYFSPKGRDARLLDWRFLEWDRQEWVDVHITSCVLFIVFSTVHIYYNWRILWGGPPPTSSGPSSSLNTLELSRVCYFNDGENGSLRLEPRFSIFFRFFCFQPQERTALFVTNRRISGECSCIRR